MEQLILPIIFALALVTSVFAVVNINTATADELVTLNGIGKSKAEAIVAYRTAHGNFKSVESLTKV